MLSPQSRGELIREPNRITMAVEVDHKASLAVVIAYDETGVRFLDRSGQRERRAGINHSLMSLAQTNRDRR